MFFAIEFVYFFVSWVKRKSIHLDKILYQGPLQASATICFYKKFDVIKAGLADQIVALISDIEKRYHFDCLVFCVMPDHVHLLIELEDESKNFLDLIYRIKQIISFKLRGKYPSTQLWQDRFFDHIIRNEKELIKTARYILENPVRKELVMDFREWKYSGGYFYEIWKYPNW